jgi:YHS domain-containing protein
MLNLLFALAVLAAPAAKPASNATCPVLGNKVDGKSPIVVVRGREYRICCAGCEGKLKGNPENYLKTDGTPRNAH